MKNWTLTPQGEKRFLRGHPWVFSNELQKSPKGTEPGELIELLAPNGKFLAFGYGNPSSLIAFRVLSRTADVDPTQSDFLVSRLEKAALYRIGQGFAPYSFRLCFSEADGLPGLIVDRFLTAQSQQIYVVQVLTAGMEKLLEKPDALFQQLDERLQKLNVGWPQGENTAVVIRRDSRGRTLEGLPRAEPEIFAQPSMNVRGEQAICVRSAFPLDTDPVVFNVDLLEGQKTGFFLDQAQNVVQLIQHLPLKSGGHLRVLDLFSYVGQWGAQIARAGKRLGYEVSVLSVDASEDALHLAQKNVERQGAKSDIAKMDILEEGSKLPKGAFDVVICDPPALIQSKKDIEVGKRAYTKVNALAMTAAANSALFVSCSCSQHLSEEDLTQVVMHAERKSKRQIRWLGRGLQAPDHPVLSAFPQGQYLKSWVGRVGE